jgi:hypothetical protein
LPQPWKKVAKNVWATIVFFKKLPRVNHHPMVENSPNLVTMSAFNSGANVMRTILGNFDDV